jgi:ectoine hydroxylase
MKEHCLSPDERREFFETKGYLVVPGALEPATVASVSAAIDRHADRFRDPAFPNVNTADILGLDEAFLDLLDCPRVFPKIWGMLGWNIWVSHSHFNVNPPQPRPERFYYGWHLDGGSIRADVPVEPSPLLSVKVAYYLTDVAEDGGPTWMVEDAGARGVVDKYSIPPGARPLPAKAGTAVIFSNRVLHSLQSPNTSPVTRKAAFITYAYRWLQPVDRSTHEHLRGKTDPVRQQLLGLTTTYPSEGLPSKARSGRYYPLEEDVPLRGRIRELLGADAHRFVARDVHAPLTRGYT